jgi:hypothetical protein
MAFGKADIWGHVLAGMAAAGGAGAMAEMGHGNTAGNLEEIRKTLNEGLAKAAAQNSVLANKS